MKRVKWSILLPALIIAVMFAAIPMRAATIILKRGLNLQSQLTGVGNVFVVNGSFDLGGDTIQLPGKSVIKFGKGGRLQNGVIRGSNSRIIADNREIFRNVNVAGTWRQTDVYGRWFRAPGGRKPANQYFCNLMLLCKGDSMTRLYTPAATYYVEAVRKSAPILMPSNVYWQNRSTIMMLPCSYDFFNTVYIHRQRNVTIDGGTFIGDSRTHTGTKGEWGHGIRCGGSENVVIKNVTSSYCWGDGIDLIEGDDSDGNATVNCRNVLIENVRCRNNRRQGLSIEAAENVVVKNSEFSGTGHPAFTEPGAGIDIEPWTGLEGKIKNVTIDNCRFSNNKGPDLRCHTYFYKNGMPRTGGDVEIKNCTMGVCEFRNAIGAKVENCNITERLQIRDSKQIDFENCVIEKYKEIGKCSAIEFRQCEVLDNTGLVIGMAVGTGVLAALLIPNCKYQISNSGT
ncbi:MAG: right-handed parallel beta-helix repeat-containing protein [Candidatus Amulumruptor caecigallinarius]|nr:right-handed parallel beta-helix repeat-containing protein [Candidatus Amulumruptor caecigallinarius]